MKRVILFIIIIFVISSAPTQQIHAQFVIADIIKAAVKKVIRAVDLNIQRIQNKTIWLQNAQKAVENELSKLKLTEIGDWAKKQKDLYGNYFEELWKVKNTLRTYQGIKNIVAQQLMIAQEYSRAFNRSKKDKNFTIAELYFMQKVYRGILEESLKNISQVQLVITAFSTQMTDAKRLEIVQDAAYNMESNLADLRQFNQQNIRASLQRAKDQNDINAVKQLYGLP